MNEALGQTGVNPPVDLSLLQALSAKASEAAKATAAPAGQAAVSAGNAANAQALLAEIARATEHDAKTAVSSTLPSPQLARPSLDRNELIQMLEVINAKLSDNQIGTEKLSISLKRDQLHSLLQKNIDKIKKVLDKMKHKNAASLAMMITGWVVAALAVVAATIVAVVSFGAGTPLVAACALAGAAIAVTLTALTQAGVMDKLVTAMSNSMVQSFENMGMSESKAKLAAHITSQVIIAAIVLTVQIGLAILSGGAGAGEAFETIAETIGKFATKATQIAMQAAQVGEGLSTVAQGAAGTAASAYQYEADTTRADIQDNKAFITKLHALLENEQDKIREIIQEISQSYLSIDRFLKSNNEAAKRIISAMNAV